MKSALEAALKLDTVGRIHLIEEVWDSIAAHADSLPVSAWHRDELRRRKTRLTANPKSLPSWDEVKERIRRQRK